MALTAISVLAAIAFTFVTVQHREPWYFGGSVVSSLLSGGGIYLLRSMPWTQTDENSVSSSHHGRNLD